jgi:hypothetical protein
MNTNSVPVTPVPWAIMVTHLIRGKTTPVAVEFIHSYVETIGKVTKAK